MKEEKKRIAILDIGTNTFHILIAELSVNGQYISIHKEKVPVKLGKGGINEGLITEQAIARAKNAFSYFKDLLLSYNVSQLRTIATSAVRSASNGSEFVSMAKNEYDIDIEVIDGNREAELIYKGVKQAIELDTQKYLIMDIGGGSVEFIICDTYRIFWKKSFEIGGQRMVEEFHKSQPIHPNEIKEVELYLERNLGELFIAHEKYNPENLIGASGTFDTLSDIYYQEHQITGDIVNRTSHILPLQAYLEIHKELIKKNRAERLDIPGMIEMRVDLIVVSSILINYVVNKLKIEKIFTSNFALKEGLISEYQVASI